MQQAPTTIAPDVAMPTAISDKKLLLDAGEHAFRMIYDRYWERLYHKALARLGDREEAKDLVQEVFFSLWKNRFHIEIEDSLSPYLYTALKYQVIRKVYRKARLGHACPLSIAELELAEDATTEQLQYRELQQLVAAEISRLPDRMREVYTLSRVENLQVVEIAHRLNISEQTVKNTLTIAKKKLRLLVDRFRFLLFFF